MQDEYITEADVPAAAVESGTTSEIEDLKEQLAQAQARADENYNKFLLATADFENYRRRIDRQFGDMAASARKRLFERILPVIDNLERALAHKHDGAGHTWRGGVEQTLKGFEAVLAAEGVKPIDVKGKPFDPKLAEAIGTRDADGVADDTVIEEAQKGYTIGEDLLRPAQVIVAKHEPAE